MSNEGFTNRTKINIFKNVLQTETLSENIILLATKFFKNSIMPTRKLNEEFLSIYNKGHCYRVSFIEKYSNI